MRVHAGKHGLNPLKAQVQLDVHLQRSNEMYFRPNALNVKPRSGRWDGAVQR